MKQPLDLSRVKVYTNTKEDAIKALSLVGEEVYMSNEDDFGLYTRGKLIGVRYAGDCAYSDQPYLCGSMLGSHYRYIILCKDAKFKGETSYRKFNSIDEFEFVTQNHFSMGESVMIRNKKTLNESELVYSGYFVNDQYEILICLGAFAFTFDELFKGYDFHINSCFEEWHPFGIKE